jgi:peptide subunit release factor RF-3
MSETNNTNINNNNTNNNIKPTEPNLQAIMKKIETDVNPKTMQEGIALLNNPDALVGRLQAGADMFKEQTGRNMTYSEMRQMFG